MPRSSSAKAAAAAALFLLFAAASAERRSAEPRGTAVAPVRRKAPAGPVVGGHASNAAARRFGGSSLAQSAAAASFPGQAALPPLLHAAASVTGGLRAGAGPGPLLPPRKVVPAFGGQSGGASLPLVGRVGRRRALAALADPEDYQDEGDDEDPRFVNDVFEGDDTDSDTDDILYQGLRLIYEETWPIDDPAAAAEAEIGANMNGGLEAAEAPWSLAEDSIEYVNVANALIACGYQQTDLPKAWVDKLQRPTLKMVPDTMCTLVQGNLKHSASAAVAIKRLDRRSKQDMRLASIIQSLAGAPNVVTFFDSVTFAERSFLLLEPVQMSSLKKKLEEDEAAEDGHPAMPLEKALPIFIDVLRGLVEMESRGMIHAYLSESDILLHDGRALIWGFSRACLDTASSGLGYWGWDDMVGSAFRHAPEMTHGRPTGRPNSVWAAGLILGRLFLGVDVTKAAVLTEFPRVEEWLWDESEEGRDRIRGLVRRKFEIKDHPLFQSLDKDEYGDIQTLMAGMLEKDPGQRWTAHGALKFALGAAERRNIKVPAPRQAARLPDEWMDWQ